MLFPSLGELIQSPGQEQARIARMLGLPGEPARQDYTNLFVVQLFPYASIYLSADGLAGGVVRDRIIEFWKLLGRPLPDEPDHAAALLRSYGNLQRGPSGEYTAPVATQQLRRAFFWESIASWLPVYLLRARELSSTLYKAWSDVTSDVIEAEAAQSGPPQVMPLHLASAPMPPALHAAAAFVDSLFIPAVSGVILCRADLGRCAAATKVSIRTADRRHTLKLMITENTRAVCGWLHKEAARQAEQIEALPPVFGAVREHWLTRAQASATAIEEFGVKYSRGGKSAELI